MPRFRCDNEDCKQHGEIELVPHVKFIWNESTQKLEADRAACEGCGEQRAVVQEEGPIKMPWFKAENARNYNNKKVRKYNYDKEGANSSISKIPSGKKSNIN